MFGSFLATATRKITSEAADAVILETFLRRVDELIHIAAHASHSSSVLRPTCKAMGLPVITWHSFRHTHVTQLAEVGESLRTAQSLLGHSDFETTLNVYTRAIPDAQHRAVDKVAEVLFTNVHKISAAAENQKVN